MNTIPMQISAVFLFAVLMAIVGASAENQQKKLDTVNQEIVRW